MIRSLFGIELVFLWLSIPLWPLVNTEQHKLQQYCHLGPGYNVVNYIIVPALQEVASSLLDGYILESFFAPLRDVFVAQINHV